MKTKEVVAIPPQVYSILDEKSKVKSTGFKVKYNGCVLNLEGRTVFHSKESALRNIREFLKSKLEDALYKNIRWIRDPNAKEWFQGIYVTTNIETNKEVTLVKARMHIAEIIKQVIKQNIVVVEQVK